MSFLLLFLTTIIYFKLYVLLNTISSTLYSKFSVLLNAIRYLLCSLLCIYCLQLPIFSQTILKGGVTAVIEKGQNLSVSFNTPINFYFSQTGDTVTAEIKEDIILEENLIISKGSYIEGVITKINEPSSFGREGSFEIEFNKIVTENNLSVPIVASTSTNSKPKSEQLASIVSYDAALIAYGSTHGLIAGLQYGGLPLAIASHGISLLAGTGLGTGAGIIGSVKRKGKIPTIAHGLTTTVKLNSDLYILGELNSQGIKKQENKEELAKENEYKGFRFFPEIKNDELKFVINSIKKEHSKELGDYIILEINIKNNSQRNINLFYIVLQNELTDEILHPDIFLSGNEVLKTVKSFEEINTNLSFLVKHNSLQKCYLALIDPLDSKEIVKIPLK